MSFPLAPSQVICLSVFQYLLDVYLLFDSQFGGRTCSSAPYCDFKTQRARSCHYQISPSPLLVLCHDPRVWTRPSCAPAVCPRILALKICPVLVGKSTGAVGGAEHRSGVVHLCALLMSAQLRMALSMRGLSVVMRCADPSLLALGKQGSLGLAQRDVAGEGEGVLLWLEAC